MIRNSYPEPNSVTFTRGDQEFRSTMRLATWNLNNRVGHVRFRPEAAHAAVALNTDVIIFTEFFPQGFKETFCGVLDSAGWNHQLMSEKTADVANRVLVASKVPIAPLPIEFPTFDRQLPSNALAVEFPSLGLALLGVRVPAYSSGSALLRSAWEWLEATAAALRHRPAILAGDLNVGVRSRSVAGRSFQRILPSGWQRANPPGFTFFGHHGQSSQIDHILATNLCDLSNASCVVNVPGYVLAGSPNGISDHAAVLCDIRVAGHRTACEQATAAIASETRRYR